MNILNLQVEIFAHFLHFQANLHFFHWETLVGRKFDDVLGKRDEIEHANQTSGH